MGRNKRRNAKTAKWPSPSNSTSDEKPPRQHEANLNMDRSCSPSEGSYRFWDRTPGYMSNSIPSDSKGQREISRSQRAIRKATSSGTSSHQQAPSRASPSGRRRQDDLTGDASSPDRHSEATDLQVLDLVSSPSRNSPTGKNSTAGFHLRNPNNEHRQQDPDAGLHMRSSNAGRLHQVLASSQGSAGLHLRDLTARERGALIHSLGEDNILVLGLQETKVKVPITIPNYQNLQRNTFHPRAIRGVIILYHRYLCASEFYLPTRSSNLECVGAEIYFNRFTVKYISFYNPRLDRLDPEYLEYFPTLSHAILVGDFNARHSDFGGRTHSS